jgi:MATE family multidrug resistance protein
MDPGASPQNQRRAPTFVGELRELARLGGPIALVQLGMTAMNFVDAAFLGHYRAASLAAMALGNTLSWAALVFCMGALIAVDPLLSQAVGARDSAAVTRTMLRGAVLALLLALPAMALLWPADVWLLWLGQKQELIGDAASYARINTLGFLPFLWFSLLRSFLSAHARVAPQVLAIAFGNGLNALLDWLWIGGNLGCPELGVAGAAWATVACRWSMLLLLLGLCREQVGPHLRAFAGPAQRAAAFALRPLLRLLRLGAPIGGQFLLEMGVFAATALLIGWLDAARGGAEGAGPRLGGHQIAIQLASLSFMVPLGLGMAASVRVGWAIGRGDGAGARAVCRAALCAAALVMTLFMLSFLLAPGALARVLTDEPDVLRWALVLIPIAGVFQIGDGLQVVAIGCLRGAGDVRSPFWINVAGFWGLGLPLGCWLAFPWGRDQGPEGLWWGLVGGLFAVAAALLLAVRLRFLETAARLEID